MKEWILSLVCVIVLGVLLEIVLPKGQIAKYVKGTFALVVISVIIAPIPKLIKKEWKFDFSSAWVIADTTFVSETKDAYLEEKEKEVEEYLFMYGIDADVEIEKGEGFLEYSGATVFSYGDSERADEIIGLVANRLNIEKSQVKFIIKAEREKDV